MANNFFFFHPISPFSFILVYHKFKNIGFPNGYHTTETKVFETENALQNGADEIDMVINLGWVKDGLKSLTRN